MERQEKHFDFTGRYSVRLRNADNELEYLGTGTLLIRRKDERVWLLTCMHTLFKERVEPGNKSTGSMSPAYVPIRRVLVEYKANAAQYQTVTIEIIPQSTAYAVEANVLPGTVMAGNYREQYVENLSCEEDFVCLNLAWEPWMEFLPDTKLEPAQEFKKYVGYGFQRDLNGHHVGESGTLLEVTSSNINPHKFSFKHSHDPEKDHHLEMAGFSGTGLFHPDTGALVGIVCEEYRNSNNEVWAVSVNLFEEQWNHQQALPWEDVCLVRCIHTPSGRGRIFPSMRLELNLFAILSGIRGEAVVFLLNGVGTPVKDVLCGKSLRALIPNRVWKEIESSEALRLSEQSFDGLVVAMSNQEQDWRQAEQLVRNLNGIGLTGTSSKLVLFNIDVSTIPQDADDPLNLQEVVSRISEWVMGNQQFYLFSTDGLIESLQEPWSRRKRVEEAVENRYRQAQEKEDPYSFLLQEAESWPGIALDLAERCSRPDSTPTLRLAGFRLAILYSAVTNTRRVWPLFRGRECEEFLKQVVYPRLSMDEKLDFLGSLALNEAEGTSLWEKIAGSTQDEEAYADDIALFAGSLQKLIKKPVWTKNDIEEQPELLTPAFFRILLRCLNRSRTSPEQNRQALLELLRESQGNSQYWRLLLCCRWKVAAVSRQLQDMDSFEGQFLPLLLDLKPNMSNGAWSMADSIRSDLFQ